MTDLTELLTAKRSEIVGRWLRRIKREHASADLSSAELRDDLPVFFDDLIDALARQAEPTASESALAASDHGEQRLRAGFDVEEVIREYDLLGDTILEVAQAEGIAVSIAQTRLLLQIVYAGCARAVSAYVRRKERDGKRESDEHLSFVAHELRNPLSSAAMALTGLRKRLAGAGGNVLDMLDRSVTRMRELVDQVLAAARFPTVELRMEQLAVRDVVAEAVQEIAPKAEHKSIGVTIDVDASLVMEGDRRLLHSIASNLIGNAVKFSRPGGTIVVNGRRDGDHVVVELRDGCGGLGEGSPEDLFQPYVQRGTDRSGLGLGLAIVKQAVDVHRGTIDVKNVPGAGCIFTVRLPAGTIFS
ncbi:MAG TPA: HAMP domain-containing sensor histidine kinase [Candidatus Binatia bacterium]|nr:HAMP domain-containing sensor histidine kinase [Candidatus Binatia bacterium]